jgi:hypothetical protein
MAMRSRLKGARRLHRERVAAVLTDEDKAILREYRANVYDEIGKLHSYDDAFYRETLRYLVDDWNQLEEDRTEAAEPSVELMWADVKRDEDILRGIMYQAMAGVLR